MDYKKIDQFMDEHHAVLIPAQTHIIRYKQLASKIADMQVNTQSDLDKLVDLFLQAGEAMEDIGNDLQNLGNWGVEFMQYLLDEMEKEPE